MYANSIKQTKFNHTQMKLISAMSNPLQTYEREHLLKLLDQISYGLANLPGEVFSTGTRAIGPGDLYIIGLNPMGGSAYPSIRDHVANWNLESYSAFVDQCWNKSCWDIDCYGLQENLKCSCPRGANGHQRAVQKIIERALPGTDPRTVFASNAIFTKSTSAYNFRREVGVSLAMAFDACWPVHKYFLSIVRPRVIISLGYSGGESAFSLFGERAVRKNATGNHFLAGRKYPSFKWAEMSFDLDESVLSSLVVGIRHPSYVPDAANTQKFSDLVGRYLEQDA